MKKMLLLFALVLTVCGTTMAEDAPANKEIWYTTSNDKVIVPSGDFGKSVQSNTYNDGKGILTFKGDVTSIGDDAFFECSGLTSIKLPNSVTSIGYCAFRGCSGLTSIELPESVTSIGDGAFYGCSGLTSIELPESVTSIGMYAFFECSGLTSIKIPETVTSIGDRAFNGCSGLTSIKLPNSLTSIGDGAFIGCSSLTSIKIPETVTSIGDGAFIGCSSLTSVYVEWSDASKIPSLSSNVEYFPCASCDLRVPEGEKELYTNKEVWNSFRNICEPEVPVNQIWYTTSDGKVIVPSGDFVENTYNYGKGILTFNGDVTSIGNDVFSGCSSLTSIKLPNSVKSIKNGAFSGCSGLASIEIPESVTSIENGAFYGCSGLASIEIPESVKSIGELAFEKCYFQSDKITSKCSLKAEDYEYWGAKIVDIRTEDGLCIKDNCLLGYFGKGSSVTVPNSVTTIGEDAFSGCSGLTSIRIPESVTSIEYGAFSGCTGLTSVYVKWTKADKIPSIWYLPDFPYESCDLYVPYGTAGIYQKSLWNDFNIVECDPEPNVKITDADGIDGSVYLESGDGFALNDHIKSIAIAEEIKNVNVTYTRDFTNVAGSWQCWYVPFDASLDVLKKNGVEAAEIAGILLNGEGESVVAFKKMAEGTLKANTPYVVRFAKGVTVALKFTSKDLKATEETSFTNQSSYENFTFTGNYGARCFDDCYTLNLRGVFQKMGEGVELRPMRFGLNISQRENGPYNTQSAVKAFVGMMVLGDDESTGIHAMDNGRWTMDNAQLYDLMGRRVTSVQSGKVYIMNGKKYIAK